MYMLLSFVVMHVHSMSMALPRHAPNTPRRCEGGRSPQVALAPYEPCLKGDERECDHPKHKWK